MFTSKQISMVGSTDVDPSPNSGDPKWSLRPMRHEDIAKCLKIWLDVELFEAHSTVASTLDVDPEGFWVAQLDDTGEVIGMCSATIARPDTAFIGFYAVEPRYQKLGIGRELWRQTLKRFENSNMNIGLYAVPAMLSKYQKNGFAVKDSIELIIYECRPGHEGQQLRINYSKFDDEDGSQSLPSDIKVVLIDSKTKDSLFAKLVAYDETVTNFNRGELLKSYLLREFDDDQKSNSSDSYTSPITIAIVKEDEDAEKTEIVAYGCIRDDNTGGAMIGPVYADSPILSELVLKCLLERYELKPDGNISVMSLNCNESTGKILEDIGFHRAEECSRLFTNFVPTANFSKIYYVHSPNFTLF